MKEIRQNDLGHKLRPFNYSISCLIAVQADPFKLKLNGDIGTCIASPRAQFLVYPAWLGLLFSDTGHHLKILNSHALYLLLHVNILCRTLRSCAVMSCCISIILRL
jgi:hypothetical protein